ncbi:hypothetical protein KKG36_03190 [Patescibacteria group bacterium]|nr:hypothetical protein [Patescibacteria group bacterium]
MYKKILLVLSALCVLSFFPQEAKAIYSYVQVTIEKAEIDATGASFNIPSGTIISVYDSMSIELGTKRTDAVTAEGGIIVSPLVNLTDGEDYTIKLAVPGSECGGYLDDNGYCWFKSATYNQTCTSVCATHGGVNSPGHCNERDISSITSQKCNAIKALAGGLPVVCADGGSCPVVFDATYGNNASYWGNACNDSSNYCDVSYTLYDWRRIICACSTGPKLEFFFSFTASL